MDDEAAKGVWPAIVASTLSRGFFKMADGRKKRDSGPRPTARSQSFQKPSALDFFAGGGLVTEGLRRYFRVIWANDNCKKKAAVYTANFGKRHLKTTDIRDIDGAAVPKADLAWASFPCQDLSLAGSMRGIHKGERSALYWHWLRVLDEMSDEARPPVLCVENVVGFLVAQSGMQFKLAYKALRQRGYLAGALVLDATPFVPQSRPRSFIVAVQEGRPIHGLTTPGPLPDYHSKNVVSAFEATGDDSWIWWNLPPLPQRTMSFTEICERRAPVDAAEATSRLLSMLSERNRNKLDEAMEYNRFVAGAGYKRVRKEKDGVKRQRLEIRFDGLAGCLRTPQGGSSRQVVLLVENRKVRSRLLTIKETARLMGARETFKIPGSYNDAYRAMGDAVAVPVTRWLARHLLSPLVNLS